MVGELVVDEYRSAILEAVDGGLLVLGEKARDLIYQHVERRFQVKREQVPDRLEALNKALNTLLGSAAKELLEKMIAKNLYSKLNLDYKEHEDWMLADYANDVKKAAAKD